MGLILQCDVSANLQSQWPFLLQCYNYEPIFLKNNVNSLTLAIKVLSKGTDAHFLDAWGH